MTKVVVVVTSLLISLQVYGKVPEKELNAIVDATYCSAFLEYIGNGVQYDQIKSHKLIKLAERINSSLMRDYRTDVISDRANYISRLKKLKSSKNDAQAMYDSLKCDLKI